MIKNTSVLILLVFGSIFSSCYKDDYTPQFTNTNDTSIYVNDIVLGTNYSNQVYIDLETNQKYSSQINDWDIAFSKDSNLKYLKFNGGIGWSGIVTNSTNIFSTLNPNNYTTPQWRVDNPNGDVDSTILGDLTQVNFANVQKVVLLRKDNGNGTFSYFKFQMKKIDSNDYYFVFGPNNATSFSIWRTHQTSKNTIFHYEKYFSDLDTFKQNENIEPIKDFGYDILFTRYAQFFSAPNNFNYLVEGVLINNLTVLSYKDSTSNYDSINVSNIVLSRLTNKQDAIGWDWKVLDQNYNYSINPNYTYIIKTQTGNIYKLKFLGFYNKNNEKGYPSYEYQKLN